MSKSKRGSMVVLGLVACLAAGHVSAANTSTSRKDARPSHGPTHGQSGHHDVFSRFDADRDGAISRQEWQAARDSRPQPRRPDPAELFKRLDANGDGKVIESEFVAHHERMKHARAERREHRKAFNRHHDRLAHHDRSPRHDRQKHKDRSRTRLDANRIFAMLDADSSGQISRAEWNQARERFQARRR